ncbi:lipase family protein [Streptomyces sp. NPDC002845]
MSVPPFDHHAAGYSLPLAYWLARASDLAYKDEATIEQQAQEWGFDRVRHHCTAFTPPFPLEDTQAYTLASDHMVLTAFRGTQPTEIRDWLTDATTPPWRGPASTGYIHYGFGEALQSVYPGVRETVDEFRDNGQSVWFTGHSLGGALAMLAACRLHLEDPKLLADGVYTYGAPRTCDQTLAAACNKAFKGRFYRFVNNNDIVPELPPEPAFHHVDALRYIDSGRKIHESLPLTTGLINRAKGVTAAAFAPTGEGLRDHFIDNYLAALEHNLA